MSTKLFLPIVLADHAAYALHVLTTRWSYTVPAGKRAEIEFIELSLLQGAASAVNTASAFIQINGANVIVVRITGIVGAIDRVIYGSRIGLDSGNVLAYLTLNTGAVNHYFGGTALIREYQ